MTRSDAQPVRQRSMRMDSRMKLKRLRAIEELYYQGHTPQQIHTLLRDLYPVTRATIRNDLVAIRKQHAELLLEQQPEIREQYFGRLHQIRRMVLKGWKDPDGKIRGRDFKLAHELDKEIARLLGLRLESDTQRLTVTMEAARSYVEHICDLIVQNVRDPEDRARLLAAIEAEAGIASTEAPPA